MTSHARVVIVGGGILGCSLAYHLAREGWSDCVLLEKAELTSGSTWHAAGQVTHSTSSFALGRMAGYAIDLYKRIEAETGQSVTFHGCGSLRLAYGEAELDWLRYTTSVGAALGHPMEIIGPQEIRARHPFYGLDGVRAALWTPQDGHVDPAGATFALAAGARAAGARIVRGNRVTDIRREPGGEWRVVTEQGDYICEHVVNAGGTYARQIGAWSGLDLPITCMTHHYLVTDTVPEFLDLEHELPVVRDDAKVSGYIRMEQRSGLIGIYEKADPNTVWLDGTPWESESELFEPHYDRIMPWLENAMQRMPVLAELGIKRVVHGAITHPPDGNMLLGPAPGLVNYWCCCGCQIGIGWGPGAGRYLAQWMVHGAAEISMREFDPRRYGDFADLDYAVTKAREDYLLRHEIPYPHFNRLAGRPVKTSPLYARLDAAGAVHEEVFGWERPRWFARDGMPKRDLYSFRRAGWHDAVAREVDGVRERVGIMDISSFAKIDVVGPDAGRFLDRMIANRVPRRAGGIVLSHLLNERGTIEAEITLARVEEERFYLVCAAFFELRVRDWLSHHLRPDERVRIENVSRGLAALALQGPCSREVLAALTQTPLDNDCFPWLTARRMDVAGSEVRALRVSYAGELGWELHVPVADARTVFDALWSAGETHGIAHFGSFAMNAMRMEKMFKGAAELTNEVTLPEAGLMRFARLDKPGGFLGDTATRQSADAAKRPWQCVYLRVDAADADCLGGEAILDHGRRVGAVSSGAWGPSVRASLAFGYVPPALAAPGTDLEVVVLGERRAARVLGEALHDPGNERPRA
ncbi:MAG: FAD-dependent oxidoreductase [Gammaproteobacteria bacterium]|nr:FAD-dependent oxidoreductase [Gammaproteobacteria bacterium]